MIDVPSIGTLLRRLFADSLSILVKDTNREVLRTGVYRAEHHRQPWGHDERNLRKPPKQNGRRGCQVITFTLSFALADLFKRLDLKVVVNGGVE